MTISKPNLLSMLSPLTYRQWNEMLNIPWRFDKTQSFHMKAYEEEYVVFWNREWGQWDNVRLDNVLAYFETYLFAFNFENNFSNIP